MFGKEVNGSGVYRLCREVDGKIVDIEEIEASTVEEAIIQYRSKRGLL